MKRKPDKKPSKKIDCLFHTKQMCICIKPVTTSEQLAIRIKNEEGLAKFGIKI